MGKIRRTRTPVLTVLLVIAGLAFGFVAAPAAAQDQVVNQSSSSNADSIQEAINGASSGDTIEVRAGTYNESVTVNKSLTLRGAGADSTTIVGAGESAQGESQPFAAIHVDDENGSVRSVTIEGFSVRNPDGKFGIFAGTGTTNGEPDGISGLVIRNNVVRDISTNSSGGSLTGGPAGIGIRADYGTDGNPGIEIRNNTISNVQSDGSSNANGITLKSFTGEAGFGKDSGGNDANDPSSPPATDTDVVGNDISNIDAGNGSGRHIAKGISVSGEFKDVLVEGNDISGLTAEGTGTNFARGITFTENGGSYSGNKYDIDEDGNGERIGPQEFNIKNNEISQLSAGVFSSSIFIGGYEQLESHSVNRNTISDGAVERVAGNQPGFQPGDGDALNASANIFIEESADLYYSDGSDAANLDTVLAENDFGRVDVIVGSTAITRPPNGDEVLNVDQLSSFDKIQNAVDNASAGDTIAVGIGTFDESVTVDKQNLTLVGPNFGLAGDSSDRIPEATIKQGVRITADGVVLAGFNVTGDVNGILLGPDAVPSDVTITNNVVRDVDGGTAGDKGVGNGINLQFNGEFEQTSSGVEITNNLITGVSTADASNGASADAIGIQVLPRGNDVKDLRIANNVIEDIEPGSTTGRSEARAVSIATQFTNTSGGTRGDFGQATGPTIEGNEVSDLTADFARAFNLFEDERGPNSGPNSGERVGPVNFTITENSVDGMTSEDDGLPDLALFVGDYGDFGDAHSVQRNDFLDGVENFGGGSDTLNATENWWGDATGPAGDGPGDGPGFLRGDGEIDFRPFLGSVQEEVTAVETVEITSSGDQATVESNDTSVDEITIQNDTLTGEVTIQEFESPPKGTNSPSGGEMVTSVDIDVPEGAENDDATMQISVNRSEFSADEDDLVVDRFDDAGGERERLRTDVIRSGGRSVTLEADTPGFSVFIVSQPVQEEQDPSASTDGGSGDDDDQLGEEQITDVRPGATGTTVAFPGQDLEEITFATEDASGSVTVEEFETLPSGAPPLDDERPVVGVFDISVPDGLVDTPATIVIELSVERFDEAGFAPEEAVVLRGTDGGYESLSTGIDVDDGVVSITAETSGFSPFVVTDAQQTATATATQTPTPTDDEPTPTDDEPDEPDEVDTVTPTGTEEQPGFGIAAAVAALVGAMLLLARRRDGNE